MCVFSLFISNTSVVRINFGANLDAQNAGNDISGIQISKMFWGSTPPDPPFMHGILATHVAFSHCYPPLIYYLTERSLFKKCPPPTHGKILKKGPAEQWASIPKVVGSNPTVARHICQACPVWIYTQSNITQASYSPEYITPTQQI